MADQPLPDELAALGIDEVKVARLDPGDVIVLTVLKLITPEDAEAIRERLAGVFADHRIVVLDGGVTLEILRESRDSKQVHLEWNATAFSGDEFLESVRKNVRGRFL